ncbi:MAG: hypothetical protein F4Y38_01030 [Gemmatimonadetes bacterium]|nr:hypothetical protein [Gemmatimonadota bacterium]MYG85979.1 hypothetical protein [Gemmatimonadota bacterium]MYJ89347.1 hypothetical protein [Gemmatimonadota bacterium]
MLTTIVLLVDESTHLLAKAGSQDGSPVLASFTWGIEDAAFADVEANGTVTGVSNGSTMLTLSVDGRGIDIEIPITVYKAVDTITVTDAADGSSSTLQVGGTVALTATALDESDADSGVEIPGIEFEWDTSDPSVATVEADDDNSAMATVTAKGDGEATISVTAVGHDADAAEYEVTVFDVIQGPASRIIIAESVIPNLPLNVEINADSSAVDAAAVVAATLQRRTGAVDADTGMRAWAAAADGVDVMFEVVSGSSVRIATAEATTATSGGNGTAQVSIGFPADATSTGVTGGVGKSVIKVSAEGYGAIYVEVTVTRAASS